MGDTTIWLQLVDGVIIKHMTGPSHYVNVSRGFSISLRWADWALRSYACLLEWFQTGSHSEIFLIFSNHIRTSLEFPTTSPHDSYALTAFMARELRAQQAQAWPNWVLNGKLMGRNGVLCYTHTHSYWKWPCTVSFPHLKWWFSMVMQMYVQNSFSPKLIQWNIYDNVRNWNSAWL